MSDVEWAGVRFTPMFHHDGRFFRQPGLFALVHSQGERRTLLFVDHADNIAVATSGHRLFGEALRLGFNELNINLDAVDRVDRLLLRGHIIKRCEPLLNVLEPDDVERTESTERLRASR